VRREEKRAGQASRLVQCPKNNFTPRSTPSTVQGVGGLLLLLLLALAMVWGGGQLLNSWSEHERPYPRGIGLGLLAGLSAMLLHSASDFNLHITANAMLFVLLLGLATRLLVFGCSPKSAAKTKAERVVASPAS